MFLLYTVFSRIKFSNNFPHLTIVKPIALRLSFEVTPAIRLHNKLNKNHDLRMEIIVMYENELQIAI